MDHAIGQLKDYMRATVEMHREIDTPKEVVKPEIQAFVDALNILEKYYYDEAKTKIENVLY